MARYCGPGFNFVGQVWRWTDAKLPDRRDVALTGLVAEQAWPCETGVALREKCGALGQVWRRTDAVRWDRHGVGVLISMAVACAGVIFVGIPERPAVRGLLVPEPCSKQTTLTCPRHCQQGLWVPRLLVCVLA